VTFNEALSQTIAMLHQHGRVSYRALQRQFAMPDDYLADLTDAILFAYPQVREAEGRGLVWMGDTPLALRGTGGLTALALLLSISLLLAGINPSAVTLCCSYAVQKLPALPPT
jgi:hypothetical protein